jgi:hypothetical protein
LSLDETKNKACYKTNARFFFVFWRQIGPNPNPKDKKTKQKKTTRTKDRDKPVQTRSTRKLASRCCLLTTQGLRSLYAYTPFTDQHSETTKNNPDFVHLSCAKKPQVKKKNTISKNDRHAANLRLFIHLG